MSSGRTDPIIESYLAEGRALSRRSREEFVDSVLQAEARPKQGFVEYRRYFVDDLGLEYGWSVGVHIGRHRMDIHFLRWIISIGKIPIYRFNKPDNMGHTLVAVSDSFHDLRKNQSKTARLGQSYCRLRI